MAKAKGFPFVSYTGQIGIDGQSWPIRFKLCHSSYGEPRFLVSPMRLTDETAGLWSAWDVPGQGFQNFWIKARSSDGVEFESDHIIVPGMKQNSNRSSTTFRLLLKCQKGVFRSEPPNPIAERYARYLLCGFEAFPAVRTICPLGEIVMAGEYPVPKTKRLSGHLHITAPKEIDDFTAWRSKLEPLYLHIQHYMSFAQSRLIRSPVEQIWDGRVYEWVVRSQSHGARSAQAVIHPMNLQSYFEKVVTAFFEPPVKVQKATHALQWFASDARYTETRLLNVLTAIENLTNSNLPEQDALFLPDLRFRKLAKAMRDAARKFATDQPLPPNVNVSVRQAEEEMLANLSSKMMDLNRRSLHDKILALAKKWDVPLADLVADDAIAKAIKARNNIVHRGWYYEPGTGAREQHDLWNHVMLMREVVIRFVLTSLAYQGNYLSFRGGQKTVPFPPPLG